MHIKITQVAYTVLYFDIFVFLIFIANWYKPGIKITVTIGAISVLAMLVCMVIDLVTQKFNQFREDM